MSEIDDRVKALKKKLAKAQKETARKKAKLEKAKQAYKEKFGRDY